MASTPHGCSSGGAAGQLSRRSLDTLAGTMAGRFGDALRVGDSRLAERVADDALAGGLDVASVHSRVIAPAMASVGALWERGAIGVADEHLATAISHGVVARVFPQLLRGEQRSRERVMLAAVQGEHHALGLRMVADVLEGAGFDVLYVGPDVPLDSLLESCVAHQPAVVGLSATMALNVPPTLLALSALARLQDPPALMVGGGAMVPATEAGLRCPLVLNSSTVVGVVERLIAEPQAGDPVPAGLLERLPGRAQGGRGAGKAPGTVTERLSATALAATEASREAARNAFAMEQLASRDPLTGLPNRRAHEDRVHELSAAGSYAMVLIDVDGLKQVNDTYGHQVGDKTLTDVGSSILSSVRPGDFPARIGGDEFVVLAPKSDTEEAAVIAERIRRCVIEEVRDPPVTVSVGVAGFGGDARLTTLQADRALYGAKAAGRNQVVAERR